MWPCTCSQSIFRKRVGLVPCFVPDIFGASVGAPLEGLRAAAALPQLSGTLATRHGGYYDPEPVIVWRPPLASSGGSAARLFLLVRQSLIVQLLLFARLLLSTGFSYPPGSHCPSGIFYSKCQVVSNRLAFSARQSVSAHQTVYAALQERFLASAVMTSSATAKPQLLYSCCDRNWAAFSREFPSGTASSLRREA